MESSNGQLKKIIDSFPGDALEKEEMMSDVGISRVISNSNLNKNQNNMGNYLNNDILNSSTDKNAMQRAARTSIGIYSSGKLKGTIKYFHKIT